MKLEGAFDKRLITAPDLEAAKADAESRNRTPIIQ